MRPATNPLPTRPYPTRPPPTSFDCSCLHTRQLYTRCSASTCRRPGWDANPCALSDEMRCASEVWRWAAYGLTLGLCASPTKSSRRKVERVLGAGRLSAVRGRLVSVARRNAQVATSAAVGGVVYITRRPAMLGAHSVRVVVPGHSTGCWRSLDMSMGCQGIQVASSAELSRGNQSGWVDLGARRCALSSSAPTSTLCGVVRCCGVE